MSLAAIALKLDEIEAEMKRIGYWEADPPADALAKAASDEARFQLFYGLRFEQYLQLVVLPAARRLRDQDLPRESKLGLMAMRQYDYHSHVPEAQTLLNLLYEFDALVEARAR